jgi:hypothetical protein
MIRAAFAQSPEKNNLNHAEFAGAVSGSHENPRLVYVDQFFGMLSQMRTMVSLNQYKDGQGTRVVRY